MATPASRGVVGSREWISAGGPRGGDLVEEHGDGMRTRLAGRWWSSSGVYEIRRAAHRFKHQMGAQWAP
uniref:Uncharacterized protein n=1 Tax=Aegilops tauschii TaxID=37682 RepID=M8C3X2_AEGTA